MKHQSGVESQIAELKKRFTSGTIEYDDAASNWTRLVRSEFRKYGLKTYGIYIIRNRESRTILYIGMAGTLDDSGQFKDQDLMGRLTNTRAKSTPANAWFRSLIKDHGPICVEYIILNIPVETPSSIKESLLAAFVDEHKSRPTAMLPD